MQKTLLSAVILLLLSCVNMNAQTTVTTWYVIPPTSGCNGVWAVDAVIGCGQQYIFNPNFPQNCGQFMGTVADTTYIQLCSFPCDVTVAGPQGPCAFCTTGTMTGQPEQSADVITTTYPNPVTTETGWNILLRQPGENVTVNIYNSLGQLVISESHERADQIVHVDISALTAGAYFADVTVNGATSYHQTLVVTQ